MRKREKGDLTRNNCELICRSTTCVMHVLWVMTSEFEWKLRFDSVGMIKSHKPSPSQNTVQQCKIDQYYFIHTHLKRMIMNDHVWFVRRLPSLYLSLSSFSPIPLSYVCNRNESTWMNNHACAVRLYHLPSHHQLYTWAPRAIWICSNDQHSSV